MKAHAIFRAIGESTRKAGEKTGADKRKALGTHQATGPRLTSGEPLRTHPVPDVVTGKDGSNRVILQRFPRLRCTAKIGAEHRRDLK